ncbi:MAG TPA: hypothetical protein VGU23_03920 [Acidobacteriaceae bacterium]|nr:hypothetical protein [Acidobacteriaceae bacterium]
MRVGFRRIAWPGAIAARARQLLSSSNCCERPRCGFIHDGNAPTRHTLQYSSIFGSRSIYDNGRKAELAYPNDVETKHGASNPPFDESAWELYNLNDDPTERIDLGKKYPEKLAQLKAEFEEQAQSHHLYPYITFDDVYRIHHTYLPAPLAAPAQTSSK